MPQQDDTREILLEVRDKQLRAIENREKHISLTQDQVERARQQIAESIELQGQVIGKTRPIMRIAVPGIVLCIPAILYLVITYL